MLIVIPPPVPLFVDDGVASTSVNGLTTPRSSTTTTELLQGGDSIALTSDPVGQQSTRITEEQKTTTTASLEAGSSFTGSSLPTSSLPAVTDAEPTSLITQQTLFGLRETERSTTGSDDVMVRDSTTMTGKYFNNVLLDLAVLVTSRFYSLAGKS